MAEITNPQVVDYANNYVRPFSDAFAKLQLEIQPLIDTYGQRDLGTIINDAGAGNLIADGSDVDGRTRVTGGDVYQMETLLADFKAFLTQQRLDIIYRWQAHSVR